VASYLEIANSLRIGDGNGLTTRTSKERFTVSRVITNGPSAQVVSTGVFDA